MPDETKNYAAGFWIREKTFQNGNIILNCSGDTAKFVEWLRSITDERGQFRIGISRRKEVSDKGISHTIWQDTWKPTQQRGTNSLEVSQQRHEGMNPAPATNPAPLDKPEESTELPF